MKQLVAAATVALVVAVVTGSTDAAPAEIPLDVTFLSTAECHVAAGAATSVTRGLQPAAGEFGCPIPPQPARTSIRLSVTLPAGAQPGGATFPRLAWRVQGGAWRGTATLPSAPAFVRVPVAGGPADRTSRLLDTATLAGAAMAVAWTLARGRRP